MSARSTPHFANQDRLLRAGQPWENALVESFNSIQVSKLLIGNGR